MTLNRLFSFDKWHSAKNVILKYDRLFKILLRLFNALDEPQVCVTCPSFLSLIRGVVLEGLAGFASPPKAAFWHEGSPLGLGQWAPCSATWWRPSRISRRRAP